MKRMRTISALLALTVVAAGCTVAPVTEQGPSKMPAEQAAHETGTRSSAETKGASPGAGRGEVTDTASERPSTQIYRGSGVFLNREAGGAPEPGAVATGKYTMNFERTDVREVVKIILGDTLKENYTIDPRVRGGVTLQTSRPVERDALLSVLETVLQMNGAAMIEVGGVYHVVPAANALQSGAGGPDLAVGGEDIGPGMQLRVIPLEFIAAQEMQKILQPMMPANGIVRVDTARNLLILAGTSATLRQARDTVEVFDVNWLEGMSVGLFTLKYVDTKTVINELETVFGETTKGPMAGMFRLIPVERLNAVLVVSPQPAYLEQAEMWVERLDRGGFAEGRKQLHVYRVQNGKAVDIAGVLNELLTGRQRDRSGKAPEARVAPGYTAAEAKSEAAKKKEEQKQGETSPVALTDMSDVRIIADEPNNSLIVLATPREYDTIEAAIRTLDVPPRQVLVEATIAEITLEGSLEYGLQWFFKNNDVANKYLGTGALSTGGGTSLGTSPGGPVLQNGFTYALTNGEGVVRALFDALSTESSLRVLSSPQLLVLDNETAEIRVGDQVPIITGTSTTDGGVVTESIQYRDTGVLLTVTPRVNAGGLVTMEISQEVTDVGADQPSANNQPRFLQRNFQSVVTVQSGQNILLGGLIRDRSSYGNSGIPGLYNLPLVGPLFGSRTRDNDRTELIVLMTPYVASNQEEAQKLTEEFRKRMKEVSKLVDQALPPEAELEPEPSKQ